MTARREHRFDVKAAQEFSTKGRSRTGPNLTLDNTFEKGLKRNTLFHFWNTRGKEQNLPFDVDALLIFGKVVECRSLSKAAALLDMPKSTVSRKLGKLESDLGIKLLRKNTHQLTVTDLGEKIYDHGVKILTEANRVRELVESSKQEPQGELRVAMPVFVGIELSPPVRARANSFQVCKQYILQGLGIGAMPNQIICTSELRDGSIVPVLPEWSAEQLDVHMIYPFHLSFSTLISAFYDTAREIIVENSARS